MNDDGKNHRKVTKGNGDKTDAAFSPDGQWIVYHSNEGDIDFTNRTNTNKNPLARLSQGFIDS
jgi:Tol biopolymer transport system component